MNGVQIFNLYYGTLYVYGEKLKWKNFQIPEQLDSVDEICEYAKDAELQIYYWPEEHILGYMEECQVERIADRYQLIIAPETFFSFVENKDIRPLPKKLMPKSSKENIDIHCVKIDENNELFCIGSVSAIKKLREYPKKNLNALADFLALHNIYCGIQCDNKKDLIQIPEYAINLLYGSGLIVDLDLFVEAMILSKLAISYQSLDIIRMTKKELDELVKNTWWKDKFKIG